MRHTARLGVGAAVIAVVVTASACGGGSTPGACGGVGVTSGVGVMFLHRGYTDLVGASYELCARGKCVKGELKQEAITRVSLPLPTDVDPDSGTVRFRVTPKGSRSPEIDAATDVELTHQSDGCGGGAYNRWLAFTKEGGLTTKIPASVTAAWREHLNSMTSP
ncbi:hypothetical protein ABTY98_11650 [Streptomyces sp. NPDC096040]|uniref:hypothetical protein n=1 Tax=Streptomyces sp. NPDC096040 TaxID=3155541 RepID=UPI003329A31D